MPADVRLSRPSYRVIRCAFEDLERQIRMRDWYELVHVTEAQDGQYTLFFKLRPSQLAPTNSREHVLEEALNAH